MAKSEEYIHYFKSLAKKTGYFDWYLYTKLSASKFLNQLFYKKGEDRVIYSNRSVALRRRLEQLQLGIKEDMNIVNLQLPFTSFFNDGSLKTDDNKFRFGSSFVGHYNELYGRWLHFQPTNVDFKVTCYLDNEQDFDMMQTILLWEKSAVKKVIFYQLDFRGKAIDIPIQFRIKDITAAPTPEDFTTAPLYLMSFTLSAETVSFLVNFNQDGNRLPLGNPTEDDWVEGTEDGPIAEKVILDFVNTSLGYSITPEDGIKPLESNEFDVKKEDTKTTVEPISNTFSKVTVSALFADRSINAFEKFYYDEEGSYEENGDYTARLVVVPHEDFALVTAVNLILPEERIRDVTQNIADGEIFLQGLKKNSTYQVALSALNASNNVVKVMNLTFSTPEDEPILNADLEKAETPEESSRHRIKKLVGSEI